MFLISILAVAYVIGIVQSTPTSTYQRRDLQIAGRPGFLSFNQVSGLPNGDLLEPGTIRNGGGVRLKRLGSLSIVNPLDVLRDRVLLELARRKMRQNQRQVDANRRFLQTIGKREISNTAQLAMDLNEDPDPTSYTPSKVNDFLYAYRFPENDIEVEGHRDQHQQFTSERGTERRQVWESHGEDPVVQETENDQTRRMATELNLL